MILLIFQTVLEILAYALYSRQLPSTASRSGRTEALRANSQTSVHPELVEGSNNIGKTFLINSKFFLIDLHKHVEIPLKRLDNAKKLYG